MKDLFELIQHTEGRAWSGAFSPKRMVGPWLEVEVAERASDLCVPVRLVDRGSKLQR